MPSTMESENGVLQFQWGKRRGVGNANKDVYFYESFIYDEENYSLYDNVYLFKEDDPIPYVGKILKIWEQPGQKKRVKILWFFRPSDINIYLFGHASSEKELFLACGDGVGLSNVNPLEAIAGKCYVICTSRDERNPQPSKHAIEKADFLFSRFFDVGSCTVVEKPPETIAGVELKFLLNQPEEQDPDKPVKLESVDLGALDQKTVKQLGPSTDFVKKNVTQNEIDPRTRVPIIRSDVDPIDNDVKKIVKPVNKQANDGQEKGQEKSDTHTRKRKYVSDEDTSNNDPILLPKEPSPQADLSEAMHNTLDVLPQKPSSATPYRSRLFADMPWKARLEKANKLGKLLFLENLDPSYTSSEIEELLHEALKIDCTVKLIPQVTFQNPHYGQAYAICNSKNEAVSAVQLMDEKCLIVSDGRALSAKLGMMQLPPKSAKFPGHLRVEKGRLQPSRVEHKQAVATSHCSQSNTIEFELALDWLVIHHKYQQSKEELFKKQYGQLRSFMSKYTGM